MSIVKYIIKEEYKRLKQLIKFYEKEMIVVKDDPYSYKRYEKQLKKAKKNFDECERFLKVD